MHRLSTSFVLGYHGCDRTVADRLVNGDRFAPSENDYDWLGSGIYFWEANPLRALEWARHLRANQARLRRHGDLHYPAVVGAVIDLRRCLDLLSASGIEAVKLAHASFLDLAKTAGIELPRNSGGSDLLSRKLDCAVINHLHQIRREKGLPETDTVRGVFIEGDRIYEQSGFFAKTHIQVCVLNADCIRGVFHVPEVQEV